MKMRWLILATVLLCVAGCAFRVFVLGAGPFDRLPLYVWTEPDKAVLSILLILGALAVLLLTREMLRRRIRKDEEKKEEPEEKP